MFDCGFRIQAESMEKVPHSRCTQQHGIQITQQISCCLTRSLSPSSFLSFSLFSLLLSPVVIMRQILAYSELRQVQG